MWSGSGTPGKRTTLGRAKIGIVVGNSMTRRMDRTLPVYLQGESGSNPEPGAPLCGCASAPRGRGGSLECAGVAAGRASAFARRLGGSAIDLGNRFSAAWLVVLVLLPFCACSESLPRTPEERGARVYASACTSCHHVDPHLAGATGPAIAGSARELVEARVLRAQYPPGYIPQRQSRAMVAMPQLAPYIDDLTAFLGQAARSETGNETVR